MFSNFRKFFAGPSQVAAQLEKMGDQFESMTVTLTKLIDQEAAIHSAATARMDALANRLHNVEHHVEALRGGMNSKSEAQ